MQALPPRPPSRIRLPFLTNIAADGDINLVLESNYKHYAQLSQRAFLQDVAQQCGVDSIELVSSRDLGVRIVAASRAVNALAVGAVSSLLRLDSTQSQARPGLLIVPLSQADGLRGELTRIRSEYRDLQIVEGCHIAPAEFFPVLLMPSPRLSAVEAEARVGQAMRRVQDTLLAAETKYPSYQQHPPPQQQQQQPQQQHLVSPWGHVPGEQQQPQPQQQQQQQQQQQASMASRGGFGGTQAVPTWTMPQATISPASSGSSLPPFWQSHSSTPSLSLSPPLLTLTALLQVLQQHYGLVPAEPESSGRDFFQEWSLLLHGTVEMSGQVRECIALTISRHDDLLRYAAGVVTGATNSGVVAAAEEYLQVVRADWGFAGGRLEMEAAARCYNVNLNVFDAEEQSFWHFHPLPLPLPLSLLSSPGGGGGVSSPHREVSLLHCHGLCWLMLKEEEAAAGGGTGEEMETEVMVMGGEKEREMDDLSISLQSVASAGMLDA